MVLVPSSSNDSSEKTVLFFRDGDDESAATLVSRIARSRLSSRSIGTVAFSLLEGCIEGAFVPSLSSRRRFGGR